jgi:hypothetical protein
MRSNETVPTRVGFWAVLLLSVFAWSPAVFPGYWQGLAGFSAVWNAAHPAPIAGIANQPDLWRGAGSAAFLLAQPWLFLGLPATTAVRISFILCFLLGGLAMYAWLRGRLGDRSAALAGVVYMLLPPVLAAVYVRGSLADATVLALLPLTLAGLTAYGERRSLAGAAVAVFGLLWLWRAQAGLAAVASIVILAYALLVERNRGAVLIAAAASAAGLVSLWPLWSMVAPPWVNFGDHFLYPHQLFGVTWQVAPSVLGWQDGFPFQLGLPATVFGALGLWGWWRTDRGQLAPTVRRLLAFAYAGAAILILLTLAASAPLWEVTGAGRLLTYPWQLVLVAAPLLAAAAGALPTLLPALRPPAYWASLLAIVVLSSYAFLTTQFTELSPPARPVAVVGDNNVALLDAALVESGEPATAELTVTWQPLRSLDFDYNVFFQAIAGEGNEERVVAQLDAQPLAGQRPATGWRPGEILSETYRLDLSAVPPGAPLRYYFGYYDWRDGRRLPMDSGLIGVADDKLVLHGD